MQLVFFVRDNTLLDSIFSLEKSVVWHDQDQNLSEIVGTFPGILFFHYDDPEFNFSHFKEAVLEAGLKQKGLLIVLMSQELSVKEFKKLQIENKFIDGFLRMPIKLKDIETFVEDYKLVLNEVGESMEGAKKKNLEDPVNAKIQHRFDLVFTAPPASPKNQSTVFNDGEDIQFDEVNQHGNPSMSENAKKIPEQEAPVLDFDMGGELEFDGVEKPEGQTPPPTPPSAPSATKLSVVPDDDSGLEFNLDFGDDSSEIPAAPVEAAHAPVQDANKTTSGANFEFDFAEETAEAPIEMLGKNDHPSPVAMEESADDLNALFEADLETANAHIQELPEDGTQKTILFDPSQISDFGEKESFSLPEKTGSHSSSDLMTTDEARANIESTIKDIIRPKAMESTQEIDLSAMGNDELDFKDPTAKPVNTMSQDSATGEFDLSSVEFADKDPVPVKTPVAVSPKETFTPVSAPAPTHTMHSYEERAHTSFVSDEDSNRLQATIRQLREEREELLNQIKTFKGEARELEQDNLTLKAALDESKIEISILRKRHMVEMEDMKYRLSLNEEKKALAEERARAAEGKREKLEQRVRIDFNQVKQREKELETKLEMLTIDVDSQVQSRDQKILELRRKIDALEFNMENVSIKEQKSQDDKRKLEDKLNKIMKTLRHSIKNLEDDIDQATDDGQDDKESADPRSKA